MGNVENEQLGRKIVELDDRHDPLQNAFADMLEHEPAPARKVTRSRPSPTSIRSSTSNVSSSTRARASCDAAQAWEDHDPDVAIDDCNPVVGEELRNKIASDIAAGRAHLLAGVEVYDAVITRVAADEPAAIVRMHIIGREYFADTQGDIIAGDDTYRQWDEEWTFRREYAQWRVVAIERVGAAELS